MLCQHSYIRIFLKKAKVCVNWFQKCVTCFNLLQGDWEIYFYSFYLIEPDNLPDPQGYVVAGFCFNHVNGILFKFQPVAGSFKGNWGRTYSNC